MLQVKNSFGQLPHLHNTRISTPINYKSKYTCSERSDSNKDLLQAISVLQSSMAQNSTVNLKECVHLLRRHQLRCPCDNTMQNMTTTQLRNTLAAMEVTLQQKDILIGRLKVKIRETVTQFNEQLASIIKKKIVVDANSLNYEEILKIGKMHQPPRIVEKVSFRLANGSLTNLTNERNTGEDEVADEQKELHLNQSISIRDKEKEEEIFRLKERIEELEASLESITGRLEQTEKDMASLREEHQINSKELKIVKIELVEKNGEESYLIKELNNRLEELEGQAKEARKKNPERRNSDVTKLKKILTLQYLEKEQMFIQTERCYMQKIQRLENEIVKLKLK